MNRTLLFCVALLLVAVNSSAKIHSWKGTVHLIGVPFIEGAGLYSDIRTLQTARQSGTRAGAVTNLGLLGVQAALGTIILFTDDNLPPAFRIVHRIVGTGILVSALWISIEGAFDGGIPVPARYASYAQSILVAAPLALLTF